MTAEIPRKQPHTDAQRAQASDPSAYLADEPFAECRWKDIDRLSRFAPGDGDVLVLAVLPSNETATVWMETAPTVRDPITVGTVTYLIERKRLEITNDDEQHYVVYCTEESEHNQ